MHRITNLTGVPKVPNAPNRLKRLYKRIFLLTNRFPDESLYKRNLEAIICRRLAVVQEAGDDEKKIENDICCGKIEMLVAQAESEIEVLQKMLIWKPWEPLVEKPPEGQWDWPPVNP